MLGSIADAQVVPPAQTIPETPTLQNETLKPLDYRNKYDIYGGFASSHFNAGPALIPGANLGGFDVQGTMWLSMRLGATANVRGYYGTTGVVPNPYGIHGPFVYGAPVHGWTFDPRPQERTRRVDLPCAWWGAPTEYLTPP